MHEKLYISFVSRLRQLQEIVACAVCVALHRSKHATRLIRPFRIRISMSAGLHPPHGLSSATVLCTCWAVKFAVNSALGTMPSLTMVHKSIYKHMQQDWFGFIDYCMLWKAKRVRFPFSAIFWPRSWNIALHRETHPVPPPVQNWTVHA